MNYWFLYYLDTGKIYGRPYFGYAQEWTNIPADCGVLGPFPEGTVPDEIKDAYQNPGKYLIQDGLPVLQPTITLAFASGTITATIQNPPEIIPTECTFTVLGQTFTMPIADNQAIFAIVIHPSIAGQQILVTASAAGCVDGNLNIGGDTSTATLQIYTDAQGASHIAPTDKAVLQAYYASAVPAQVVAANTMTAIGMLVDVVFGSIVPALNLTLTTDQQNALNDIKTNILGKIPVILENAYPSGGQPNIHYQSFRDNWPTIEAAANGYISDFNSIPNLV